MKFAVGEIAVLREGIQLRTVGGPVGPLVAHRGDEVEIKQIKPPAPVLWLMPEPPDYLIVTQNGIEAYVPERALAKRRQPGEDLEDHIPTSVRRIFKVPVSA